MNRSLGVTWAGQRFTLYAERAALWEEQSALLIADPHFGKTATFRAAGIPMPEGTTQANIQRLDDLLEASQATRLIILGDFFHHASGRSESMTTALGDWRIRHTNLEIILIRGNHDLRSGDPPVQWDFKVKSDPYVYEPFQLCHKPCADRSVHSIAGHIHPAISLRDSVGHALTLPCFLFGQHQALFPAFGEFTGNAVVTPKKGDRIFTVCGQDLVELATD